MKTIDTPVIYIKHKGFFNLSKLMQAVRKWFSDYDYEFQEGKYKYKTSQTGIEVEWEVKGEKKINEYVKTETKLWLRTWDTKEVEVVREGEKETTNTGRIAIELSANYTLDYNKRFHGSKFLQGLQDFYHRYIIKHTIEEKWEDYVYFKLNQLAKIIRESFAHEVV